MIIIMITPWNPVQFCLLGLILSPMDQSLVEKKDAPQYLEQQSSSSIDSEERVQRSYFTFFVLLLIL
jgi:hypothetical protein